MHLDQLLEAGNAALREWVGAATLSDPVVLKETHRSRTVRCHIESLRMSARTVIIKELREDPGCGYSDWASLQFLAEVPEARPLVPRFWAGLPSAPCFVLEDLGAADSLEQIFARRDESEIRTTLAALGICMARLHGVTHERAAEFESIRKQLPGAEHVGRHREAVTWLGARPKLDAWFAVLDITPPEELPRSLRFLAELYARPGEWLAFTHGDPAPTNNHVLPGKVRLLDFEYGAFRHALYDATAWEMLCPLPEPWLRALRETFQSELAKFIPLAANPTEFDRHWAYLCAYRGLAILSWISPKVLEEDQSWAGDWTAREALLAALSRLEMATAPFEELAAVANAAMDLKVVLESRWPAYGNRSPFSSRIVT